MPDRSTPPSECANCGAEIPPRAQACPECGADERTGWRETSIYDGLDLPDDEPQPPAKRPPGPGGLPWLWWLTGLVLLIAFIALLSPFR